MGRAMASGQLGPDQSADQSEQDMCIVLQIYASVFAFYCFTDLSFDPVQSLQCPAAAFGAAFALPRPRPSFGFAFAFALALAATP